MVRTLTSQNRIFLSYNLAGHHLPNQAVSIEDDHAEQEHFNLDGFEPGEID